MYEFNVQIWNEDGQWHYSLVQEFRNDNNDDVEPLAYGTCESLEDAAHCVATEIRAIQFEA
jgi:hypothetical protein